LDHFSFRIENINHIAAGRQRKVLEYHELIVAGANLSPHKLIRRSGLLESSQSKAL
jgi:hypothetical protein